MLTCISDPKQFNDLYCNNFYATSVRFDWISREPDASRILNLYLTYKSFSGKLILDVTFFNISGLVMHQPFEPGEEFELVQIQSLKEKQYNFAHYHVVGMFELEDPRIEFMCNDFSAILEDYSLK